MTAFLDRVNAVPLRHINLSPEFEQWLSVLVDSLNTVLADIESVMFFNEPVNYTPFDAIKNNTYIVTNAATATITLPEQVAAGARVNIVGSGAGGWILKPGAGQTIKVSAASAGTSIASTNRYDCISVICVDANTTWVTTASQTSGFTIV